MCASAVVMLDASCSEVVWRVLANHSIRQFPLQFPSIDWFPGFRLIVSLVTKQDHRFKYAVTYAVYGK